MPKADLHIHSKYSEHLSEKFFRDIGAAESYSEPEYIYRTAKACGMDFVTITDHNSIVGALLLCEKHPLDTFTGLEATAYFPEDGCPVHMLVYGLTKQQFGIINRIRTNIYDLREYLKGENLAYSVAHATYSRSSKMTVDKLEKLILLFDVFEGVNGGNSRMNNKALESILDALSPSFIEELYRKHKIEPFGSQPWIKGFTGGSDDHCGLFMGKTFTVSEENTAQGFLKSIMLKRTRGFGRNSDFQTLAFTLYKLVHDFSKSRNKNKPLSFMGRINDIIFENKPLTLKEKICLKALRYQARRKNDKIRKSLLGLAQSIRQPGEVSVDRKLELLYGTLSDVSDEYVRTFFKSLRQNFEENGMGGITDSLSSPLIGVMLSAPFVATFRYMHRTHAIAKGFKERYGFGETKSKKKGLWFTDSIQDMAAASAAVRETGCPFDVFHQMKVMVTLAENEPAANTEDIISIPCVHSFVIPYSQTHAINMPSLLRTLKEVCEYEPDEIYVSTMGPMALAGILVAKLLNIKVVGVYHPDYQVQLRNAVEAESIINLLNSYIKWFYSQMDEVYVPDVTHIGALEHIGLNKAKISVPAQNLDFYFNPGFSSSL